MDLEKDRIRGGDAQFILNHDIFREAWEAAKDSLHSQRMKAGIKDSEMHTRLIIAEQILESVKKYIENVAATGQMADMQLKAKPKFKVFG